MAPWGTVLAFLTRMSCPARHPLRVRRTRRWAALLLALSLAACHGDGGGPVGLDPSLTGHWSGTAKAHTVHFSADFTQRGQAVTGTGDFSSPLGGGPFTVAGTVSGANVDLALTSAELGATSFKGHFTAAHRVEGTLDLPGDSDLDLTLDRD